MSDRKTIENGFFISFEGPECCGKSTQATMLSQNLREEGYDVLETREPGGTPVGEELRNIVKHIVGEDAVCDEAELLIFCASRAQLMQKRILPHLDLGGIVICDRFADSTTAYQGYGRGFDLELINRLHTICTNGRWPDVTFLLDMDLDKLYERGKIRAQTQSKRDRIEEESRCFHEAVRSSYLRIASQYPDRIKTIEADDDLEVIHQTILEHIRGDFKSLGSAFSENRR